MQQKGFTMIELLIYMSIVTIALVVMTGFMADVTKSAAREKTTQGIQQNASLVIARLTQDIRAADSYPVLTEINPDQWQITIQKGGNLIYYYLENYIVYYRVGTTSTPLTTNNVRVCQFYLQSNGNAVDIDINIKGSNTSCMSALPSESVQLSSSIIPRSLLY